MFDKNLLFYDGVTLTTATTSTIVDVGKTPANGIGIELAVTSMSSSTGTLDVVVKESDSTTTGFVTIATFPQVTYNNVGARYMVVQSTKRYLELVPTTGGTSPGFVVTAGVVSGPSRGDLVN